MSQARPNPLLLPDCPSLPGRLARRLGDDADRFAQNGLPHPLASYVLETYQVDITGRYAGSPIKNPFGKASGQLSLNPGQVEVDAAAGLGFVVLKTVIAQDETGEQAMRDWAIKETRMRVEPIAGRRVGELGFTVTWKGRGWYDTFSSYLDFVRQALEIGAEHDMVVAPSCKYHLPGPGESAWRTAEYSYTTAALQGAWRAAGVSGPLVLEKDFSPTLAGDDRANERARILEWLREVPRLIKGAVSPGSVHLGLKMMNARFDDDFQIEALELLAEERAAGRGADFITYANRLFDPTKEFLGKQGVAYGGPDLSDRNLWVLDAWQRRSSIPIEQRVPISGTGDVASGQKAVAYALRGATSLQMHTLFQWPDPFYSMQTGSKTERALHHLIFHPRTGLLAWLLHWREQHGLAEGGVTRFLDLGRWHQTWLK